MAEKNVIFMNSAALLKVTELTDEETSGLIDTATITLSIFDGVRRYPVSILAFTSGSTEITEGDVITGMTGSATATVGKISLTGGSWSAGTAAGQLELSGQDGAFQAENIEVAGGGDIATIPAGDSTGLVCVQLGGGQVKVPMNTVGLTTSDFIRIESTKKYNDQFDIDAIDAGQAGYVTITAVNVVETFTGNEVVYIGIAEGKGIAFTHDGADPAGYYDAIQPADLEGVYEGSMYYLFEKIVYDGNTSLHRYLWEAAYYSSVAN